MVNARLLTYLHGKKVNKINSKYICHYKVSTNEFRTTANWSVCDDEDYTARMPHKPSRPNSLRPS